MIPSSSEIVVVDASVFVDVLLDEPRAKACVAVGELHAPVTIDAEVVHALRRRWLAGLLADDIATNAIGLFATFDVIRQPIAHLTERMWQLRQNLTAYDAAYVALAELLQAPLLTRDRRLANSSGHGARIEYID